MAAAGFEAQAACAKPGMNPAWWDAKSSKTEVAQKAIAICRGCPVRAPCLDDAITQLLDPTAPNPAGIRGGRTAAERGGSLSGRYTRKPTSAPDRTDHQKEPTTVDAPTTSTAQPVHVPVLAAAPTTEAEPVTISVAEMLMAWGMQHDSSRMQRLAGQARAALAELQQAKRREAAVSDAEARVQRARQQLAAAEKALKAAKGGTPASTPAAKAVAADDASKEERAEIRAWARAQGMEVADQGRIPRDVTAAYRAAHPAPLANAS
jgi:hypothetical protein